MTEAEETKEQKIIKELQKELSETTENEKTLAERLSEVCEEVYQNRDSFF